MCDSLWLFNIYMDGCIREMKVGLWELGAGLNVRGVEQPLVAGLYADDTMLLIESEGMLQRIVDESDRVCKRKKLKVNTGKSKVMRGRSSRRIMMGKGHCQLALPADSGELGTLVLKD